MILNSWCRDCSSSSLTLRRLTSRSIISRAYEISSQSSLSSVISLSVKKPGSGEKKVMAPRLVRQVLTGKDAAGTAAG